MQFTLVSRGKLDELDRYPDLLVASFSVILAQLSRSIRCIERCREIGRWCGHHAGLRGDPDASDLGSASHLLSDAIYKPTLGAGLVSLAADGVATSGLAGGGDLRRARVTMTSGTRRGRKGRKVRTL